MKKRIDYYALLKEQLDNWDTANILMSRLCFIVALTFVLQVIILVELFTK